MQPTPLVLLADDLTGASDAAYYFAACGARTAVWLDRMGERAAIDVAVVDLCTRLLSAEDAEGCVLEALAGIPARARLAKKIDSTLRGNIKSEVAALLEARPSAIALVVPAFPGAGRTQRDGTLYVHGTPVHETEFGSDLFAPVRSSSIVDYLPGGDASAVVAAASAGGGAAGVRDAVARAIASGVRAIAFDVEDDADLAAVASLAGDERFLWVGSAGLFAPLAPLLCPKRGASHDGGPPAHGPTLFVVGSLSEMTKRQIAALAQSGAAVEIVDPRTILIDESRKRSSVIGERIGEALAAGRDTLVALPSERSDIEAALSMGRAHGFDVESTSRELRERLIELIAPFLGRLGAIVLSGGDVARSFCMLQGIAGVELVGEAAPGIASCRAIGRKTTLVFKGGGAGEPQTYVAIADALRERLSAR